MILAGLFAGVLFIGLIVGDWLYFVRLTPDAARYGCRVARTEDRFKDATVASLRAAFPADGVLSLPHGMARCYGDPAQIAIRPQYRLFAMGFRTAWPLKGLIHLSDDEGTVRALCVKRIPWSSALLTLAWFMVVALGSATFVTRYALDGGFGSLSGVLMGAGIIGIALLVLAFGTVTVVVSYRLEKSRLMKVYDELRAALEERSRTRR
jgi:uncharacterized membrane protein YciS (DUF1049 family)